MLTLEKKLKDLEEQNHKLRMQLENTDRSPYLKKSLSYMKFQTTLLREEILNKEIHARVDSSLGTLFELKNFAFRYASIVGIDPDRMRIVTTEAIQNIVEHGYGKYAEVEFEIFTETSNPYFKMSFKHEMQPGMKYTLSQVNENVRRGDVTSDLFDIESPRGRGEYLMKELSDERRILNGVEIRENGDKVYYFKRVLIHYRDPKGIRAVTSFDDLRQEIDRLDPDEPICYFHLDHRKSKLSSVTLVVHIGRENKIASMMQSAGFDLIHKDRYFKAVFCSFQPNKEHSSEELERLFDKVRKQASVEKDE
ncbi:ATP-binding protein [Leptospira perolatii]|uniref:ATP-binding protein n=1 Tax=Leptospira perolatii TaxID=2023191 RepID=A0A2M9ZQ03_9LEPT|nr:ATP-binding protein [Leptospira perolatii]PJZ70934.1 ATP-binding protein [Leptospira perolatii]PJZ74059.1 ATP-binding protein [Leptospira perolatii]